MKKLLTYLPVFYSAALLLFCGCRSAEKPEHYVIHEGFDFATGENVATKMDAETREKSRNGIAYTIYHGTIPRNGLCYRGIYCKKE